MPTFISLSRRRDSKPDWASNNTILKDGQLGFELGTAEGGAPRIKLGDGSTAWDSLPYINRKNNLTAVVDPVAANDNTQDYSVGSFWNNINNVNSPRLFICTADGTGVANWQQINAGGGGGGGQVNTVVGTVNEIDVDATDPVNPILSLATAVTDSLALADTALQSGDNVSELTNDAGYITSAPVDSVNGNTGVVVLVEEEIDGTAIYDATFTGVENLDLDTFTALRAILTGNTTITVSNTPSSGESFVRSLKISSTATESLTLPVGWNVTGTYSADTTINDIQIEFSNFPTAGLVVKAYINQFT